MNVIEAWKRTARRESSWFPDGWQEKYPSRIAEAAHRWWYRKWYAQLPTFYQDFYPFSRAFSLTLQYADHTYKSGKAMDELASEQLRKVVDLERQVTHLRLALANANLGWNEDRVDDFMGKFFPKHEPARAALDADERGGKTT